MLYFVLLVTFHHIPLLLLLQQDVLFPLLVLLQLPLLKLLYPLLVLQLLLAHFLKPFSSDLKYTFSGLPDVVPDLLPQNLVLLLHLCGLVYFFDGLPEHLLLLANPLVDGVVLLDPFFLVDGLVSLVLVVPLDHFEPVLHHLYVQLHLLELRGRPARVALRVLLAILNQGRRIYRFAFLFAFAFHIL